MNDSTNYRGHYTPPGEPRAQGIVFRLAGNIMRYSPYIWLNYADYEAGRQIKLDFGRYDIVVRGTESAYLEKIFEDITRHVRSQISEGMKEGALTIEIIEKDVPEQVSPV